MSITTKTGDAGDTGLFGGPRVSKDDPRIEAIGDVDELNAAIGFVRSHVAQLPASRDEIDSLLGQVQHHLFDMGAELATPDPEKHGTATLDDSHVAELEQAIDHWEADLPPPQAVHPPRRHPGRRHPPRRPSRLPPGRTPGRHLRSCPLRAGSRGGLPQPPQRPVVPARPGGKPGGGWGGCPLGRGTGVRGSKRRKEEGGRINIENSPFFSFLLHPSSFPLPTPSLTLSPVDRSRLMAGTSDFWAACSGHTL